MHCTILINGYKDDVKDLIPKIGDRARFMKWLDAYNQSSPNEETAQGAPEEVKDEEKQEIALE